MQIYNYREVERRSKSYTTVPLMPTNPFSKSYGSYSVLFFLQDSFVFQEEIPLGHVFLNILFIFPIHVKMKHTFEWPAEKEKNIKMFCLVLIPTEFKTGYGGSAYVDVG